VAGFLGSPRMNFLQAKVVSGCDNKAAVELPGGAQLTVPIHGRKVEAGEPLTVGIRPENLQPVREERNALPVALRHAERTSDATVLYTDLRGSSESMTCRVPGYFAGAPQSVSFLHVDEAGFTSSISEARRFRGPCSSEGHLECCTN
jgi:ABC-type sugar transport system ATPase subunit